MANRRGVRTPGIDSTKPFSPPYRDGESKGLDGLLLKNLLYIPGIKILVHPASIKVSSKYKRNDDSKRLEIKKETTGWVGIRWVFCIIHDEVSSDIYWCRYIKSNAQWEIRYRMYDNSSMAIIYPSDAKCIYDDLKYAQGISKYVFGIHWQKKLEDSIYTKQKKLF